MGSLLVWKLSASGLDSAGSCFEKDSFHWFGKNKHWFGNFAGWFRKFVRVGFESFEILGFDNEWAGLENRRWFRIVSLFIK